MPVACGLVAPETSPSVYVWITDFLIIGDATIRAAAAMPTAMAIAIMRYG